MAKPETYVANFRKYADVVKKLCNGGHRLVVVCGGGVPARQFQAIGRQFGADRETLDRLGIVATDLNAYIFVAVLGEAAHKIVLKDSGDVKKVFGKYKNDKESGESGKRIIVCSGWVPLRSTDLDATMHAEAIGADLLINATNVDGVYTADPKKDPKAKRLPKLGYEKFRGIISAIPQTPGEYRLFDLKAIDILEKSKIKLVVIDGSDPEEILRAAEGKHSGSVVCHQAD